MSNRTHSAPTTGTPTSGNPANGAPASATTAMPADANANANANAASKPAALDWPQTPGATDWVLQARDLGKQYRLYDTPAARLRGLLTGAQVYRRHVALQGVNFSLQRGQCMGVVGSNGAGKSTLLKLITGTIRPSSGEAAVQGRITAILELGAGFHPDFTGRQNLHFAGGLIGLEARQLHALEPEILAFSELGEAIDRPVRTYSSGMTVRLAFALVTAVQPDVLIVDEALAVGDQRFQKKCIDRIQAFRDNGCSILFCSHSHYHVRQLCDVALWLDQGQQRMFGETEDVLTRYEQHLRALAEGAGKAATPAPLAGAGDASMPANEAAHAAVQPEQQPAVPAASAAPVAQVPEGNLARIVQVRVPALDESQQPPLLTGDTLRFEITAQMPPGEEPAFGVMIEQAQGVGITTAGSHLENEKPLLGDDGLWHIAVEFPQLGLNTGEYVLSVYLFDASGMITYEERLHFMTIKYRNPNSTPGLVQLPHQWKKE